MKNKECEYQRAVLARALNQIAAWGAEVGDGLDRAVAREALLAVWPNIRIMEERCQLERQIFDNNLAVAQERITLEQHSKLNIKVHQRLREIDTELEHALGLNPQNKLSQT